MGKDDGERETGLGRLPLFFLVVLIGAIITLFYGVAEPQIGFAALLAIPAALGGMVVSVVDPDGKLPPIGCFVLPTLGILFLIGLSVLLFQEGAICVAMILPLWLPAAIVGALVNRYIVWRKRQSDRDDPALHASVWLALPALVLTVDSISPVQWQQGLVSRQIVISAPPEAVWPLLNKLPAISAAEGIPNFTQDYLGIPRPSSAVVVNHNGKEIRKAIWGDNVRFDEVIEYREPLHELAWRFEFPDDSIRLYTDKHISPDGGSLKIDRGGYKLVRLADGSTQLTLRTQYFMKARIAGYMEIWGNLILGDIQDNVLAIIKQRAERTS